MHQSPNSRYTIGPRLTQRQMPMYVLSKQITLKKQCHSNMSSYKHDIISKFMNPLHLVTIVVTSLIFATSQSLTQTEAPKLPDVAQSILYVNEYPNEFSKQWFPQRLQDLWNARTKAVAERRFFDYVDFIISKLVIPIDSDWIYNQYRERKTALYFSFIEMSGLCVKRAEVPISLTTTAADGSTLNASPTVRVKHNSCIAELHVEPLYNKSDVTVERRNTTQLTLDIQEGAKVDVGSIPVMFRGPLEIAIPAGLRSSSRTLYGDITATAEVSLSVVTSWDRLSFSIDGPKPWERGSNPGVGDTCLQLIDGPHTHKKGTPIISCRATGLIISLGKSSLCEEPMHTCHLSTEEDCEKMCDDIRRQICSVIHMAFPDVFATIQSDSRNKTTINEENSSLPLCRILKQDQTRHILLESVEMGGDGGSIPGRADIVRTAGMRFARNLGGMGYLPNTQVIAGSERYEKSEEKKLRWTTCALSQEPLKPPLVACRLGQLYNKEAVLHRLLQRKSGVPFPPNMSHIDSRKDIKDLNVEVDSTTGKLVCPITQIEFDSGVKGVLLWSCGCVVSVKALDELSPTRLDFDEKGAEASTTTTEPAAIRFKKSSFTSAENNKITRKCPVCEADSSSVDDVIQLVPDIAKLPDIRQRLNEQNQKQEQKKIKKQKIKR